MNFCEHKLPMCTDCMDAADARLALLEKRDTEAVKIIMAVVGNSLLNDPIFDKLLARARAFYDGAERRE